jgi:hypothetical protein
VIIGVCDRLQLRIDSIGANAQQTNTEQNNNTNTTPNTNENE